MEINNYLNFQININFIILSQYLFTYLVSNIVLSFILTSGG